MAAVGQGQQGAGLCPQVRGCECRQILPTDHLVSAGSTFGAHHMYISIIADLVVVSGGFLNMWIEFGKGPFPGIAIFSSCYLDFYLES